MNYISRTSVSIGDDNETLMLDKKTLTVKNACLELPEFKEH
jgi:hypothetical protein